MGCQSTKSEAGEQLLLKDYNAEFSVKGVVSSLTPVSMNEISMFTAVIFVLVLKISYKYLRFLSLDFGKQIRIIV